MNNLWASRRVTDAVRLTLDVHGALNASANDPDLPHAHAPAVGRPRVRSL